MHHYLFAVKGKPPFISKTLSKITTKASFFRFLEFLKKIFFIIHNINNYRIAHLRNDLKMNNDRTFSQLTMVLRS